jgi:hypothetical protein
MASARERYQAARGLAPESDLELCRRMNVVVGRARDANPELNRAGALLLTIFEPEIEHLVVLIAPAEGITSTSSARGPAPLLEPFDRAWEVITREAFPAKVTVVSHTGRCSPASIFRGERAQSR